MKIRLKNADDFNELLMRKGFTKRGFAQATKFSSVLVTQISKEYRSPTPPVAKRITEVLEVSFDDIFIIEKSVKKDSQ